VFDPSAALVAPQGRRRDRRRRSPGVRTGAHDPRV